MNAPADARYVISAGGVNSNGTYWSGASQGPTYDGRIKPNVCAQSSLVYTASNYYPSEYLQRNGTSFSCPMIAGIAALVIQVNPRLTPQEVMEVLHSTASQSDTPDTLIGWGVINADAAVRRAEAMSVKFSNNPYHITNAQIFPNPFYDRLSLLITNPTSPVEASVYDLSGRLLSKRIISTSRTTTIFDHTNSQLPPGVYYLRLNINGTSSDYQIVRMR